MRCYCCRNSNQNCYFISTQLAQSVLNIFSKHDLLSLSRFNKKHLKKNNQKKPTWQKGKERPREIWNKFSCHFPCCDCAAHWQSRHTILNNEPKNETCSISLPTYIHIPIKWLTQSTLQNKQNRYTSYGETFTSLDPNPHHSQVINSRIPQTQKNCQFPHNPSTNSRRNRTNNSMKKQTKDDAILKYTTYWAYLKDVR